MNDGLMQALHIVLAEIERAESLLAVEDGGGPVFDRAQTEAGICALRTVAAAIEAAHDGEFICRRCGLRQDPQQQAPTF